MAFHVVLVEPEIPPNTGNIARLCGATNAKLILVGNLGFDLSDTAVKRAGLDYWHLVDVTHFKDGLEAFLSGVDIRKCHFLTTKTTRSYTSVAFQDGDYLIFGPESRGLDEAVLKRYSDRTCTIEMQNREWGMRSLNLSNSVAVVLYESLRQLKSMP